MSRLQSLQASSLSASSHSPARRSTASPPPAALPASPTTPFPQDTTTYHRKLRALLGEMRTAMRTWDECIRDGLGCARGVLDEGTEMDNILAVEDGPTRPSITPHWEAYQEHVADLQRTFDQLNKLLQKLRLLADMAEAILFEALRLKDADFSLVNPLWSETGTWTLERFVNALQPAPLVHAEHLALLRFLTNTIARPAPTPGETPFEVQKAALEAYADAAERSARHAWRDEWAELVGLEMGGWERRERVEEEDVRDRRRRKGRGGSVEP